MSGIAVADVKYSKKSKVQAHNLAPAILEGLMPITTEEEPEDIDDDAPCRVSLISASFISLHQLTGAYLCDHTVCSPYH